jgi:hypothetical protein
MVVSSFGHLPFYGSICLIQYIHENAKDVRENAFSRQRGMLAECRRNEVFP